MPKPDKKKPASSAPSKSSGKSLADLWDDTDESEASNFIQPASDIEVRINSMEHKADKEKGEAVFMNFEVIDGDEEGKTGRQMYKMTDKGGNKAPGMAYLKRDLKLLGYEDIAGKKLLKALKDISEEQPMIVVNAKQNGQYINYYVQGLVDDSGLSSKDAADENSDIAVGDRIKWDDDGEDREGEVKKINAKKETYAVEDDEGDEHTVDFADAEKAEGTGAEGEADGATDGVDPDAGTIEVGSAVKWEDAKGNDMTGEVKKINTKKNTAIVTDEDGDDVTVDLDDLELNDGDAADVPEELAVGDDVTWDNDDDESQTGEIIKIKDDKAKVKNDDDDSVSWVDLDDLTKA